MTGLKVGEVEFNGWEDLQDFEERLLWELESALDGDWLPVEFEGTLKVIFIYEYTEDEWLDWDEVKENL